MLNGTYLVQKSIATLHCGFSQRLDLNNLVSYTPEKIKKLIGRLSKKTFVQFNMARDRTPRDFLDRLAALRPKNLGEETREVDL